MRARILMRVESSGKAVTHSSTLNLAFLMNQEHEQLRTIAATTSHRQSLMKQHDNNLAMIYQTPYLQF